MRTIQKTTLEYWALIAEIAGAIAIVVTCSCEPASQRRANSWLQLAEFHQHLS